MVRPKRAVNFRIDVRQQVTGINEDGSVSLAIFPDPDRYERVQHADRWQYFDTYTNAMFEEKLLMQNIAKALETLELRAERADVAVQDPVAYVESRAAAIDSMLQGQGAPQSRASKSHEDLLQDLDHGRAYAIVTIDVHNYLAITAIGPQAIKAVHVALSHELGLAAAMHNGYLWQSTTSTLSFFFPAPNFISKVDLALAFATMGRDLIDVINGTLKDKGRVALECGIGLETGEAAALRSGLDAVHTEIGLVGLVVSVAETLARRAPISSVSVGPRAADISHVSWRKLMTVAVPDPGIPLKGSFGNNGCTFVLADAARACDIHDTT